MWSHNLYEKQKTDCKAAFMCTLACTSSKEICKQIHIHIMWLTKPGAKMVNKMCIFTEEWVQHWSIYRGLIWLYTWAFHIGSTQREAHPSAYPFPKQHHPNCSLCETVIVRIRNKVGNYNQLLWPPLKYEIFGFRIWCVSCWIVMKLLVWSPSIKRLPTSKRIKVWDSPSGSTHSALPYDVNVSNTDLHTVVNYIIKRSAMRHRPGH